MLSTLEPEIAGRFRADGTMIRCTGCPFSVDTKAIAATGLVGLASVALTRHVADGCGEMVTSAANARELGADVEEGIPPNADVVLERSGKTRLYEPMDHVRR